MSANLENSVVVTGLEKVNFHLKPKKSNDREISNYCTIVLISLASKVMLKILQARLQQYVTTENIQMYKLGLENTAETEIKLPTYVGSWRKQGSSRKHLLMLN